MFTQESFLHLKTSIANIFFAKISNIMFARSLPISQSQFSKHRSQDSSRGLILQPGQISSRSFPPSKHLKRRKAASALWCLVCHLLCSRPILGGAKWMRCLLVCRRPIGITKALQRNAKTYFRSTNLFLMGYEGEKIATIKIIIRGQLNTNEKRKLTSSPLTQWTTLAVGGRWPSLEERTRNHIDKHPSNND